MHTIKRFNSLGAFADDCAKIQASPAWRKARYEQRTQTNNHERTNFTGAETFQQALDFARLGWPAGLKALQTAKAAMPKPTARGRARRFDIAGMFPDAARAAAGDPCSMVRKAPGERKGKTVLPLIMPGSSGCVTNASSIANQATAICGLIDALENDVIRCELFRHFSTETSRSSKHKQTVIIQIKAAEDTLELSRLAGALSPSTYRRLYFRQVEANESDGWAKFTHSGYGFSRDANEDAQLFPPGALILPIANNLDDSTPASSWQAITRWAAEHGLTITAATA